MQSGITVSETLHSAFKDFISTTSQRFLLATIQNEAVIPKEALNSSSEDQNSLKTNLTSTEPLYILVRKAKPKSTSTSASSTANSSSTDFLAITYIPDTAPVRPKTLFASTRLTLVRELGQDHFSSTELANTVEEVLEAVAKADNDVDGSLSASGGGMGAKAGVAGAGRPLTESERALEEIKMAEAKVSRGTGARSAHVSSGLQIPVDGDVVDALRGLKDGDDAGEEAGNGLLVQLAIDVSTEKLHFVSKNTCTPAELSSNISSSDPRFSLYRYRLSDAQISTLHSDFTQQPDDSNSAIIFIYTCPSSSKIKERMVYASSRARIVQYAEQDAGLKIAKRLEASEPSEISAETIEEEFAPKEERKTGFAKPKRPGRR